MSLITRTYTFTDGTTAYGSQVESEFANIVNTLNNLDSGATVWDIIKITNGSSTPLIVDNSTGTNGIADFRVNGSTKFFVDSTGGLQATTGFTANCPMAAHKFTGLAAGSANGDSIRYEQLLSLLAYRRPTLKWASTTTVAIESGLDGTSGDIPVLFPDITVRTETSTTRTTFDITRNAVLTTSGAQSGLRTGSAVANTWYALYAVKVTDSSTLWCTVGDTVQPTQANYTSLNTNFGTNGWVYLGMIRYGDQSAATTSILMFGQSGNFFVLQNKLTGSSQTMRGIRMANTAGATSLTLSITSGTTGATIPAHFVNGLCLYAAGINPSTARELQVFDGGTSNAILVNQATGGFVSQSSAFWYCANTAGNASIVTRADDASSVAQDISLIGWADPVLGIGASPLL